MSVKIYLARAMSGRDMRTVVREAQRQSYLLSIWDIVVLDPVEAEGVKPLNKKLQASLVDMKKHWPRDKAMIREAHVFIDATPHLKSQGVEREAGYARYGLWKPVVRVFPLGKIPAAGNVAHFEDDLITDSLSDAAQQIVDKWGTPWKRFTWRVKMLARCLPKWVWYQIKEFF